MFSEGQHLTSEIDENTSSNTKSDNNITPEIYQQFVNMLAQQFAPNKDLNTSSSSKSTLLAGNNLCFLSSAKNDHWILDSGATDHISPSLAHFLHYKPVNTQCFITQPNGQQAKVMNIDLSKYQMI